MQSRAGAADSAFTHAVGKVDDDVQKLLDCTSGVLQLAIKLMGSRSRWADVASEMATSLEIMGLLLSRISSVMA